MQTTAARMPANASSSHASPHGVDHWQATETAAAAASEWLQRAHFHMLLQREQAPRTFQQYLVKPAKMAMQSICLEICPLSTWLVKDRDEDDELKIDKQN
jgi:hypothetical protein